MRPVAGMGSARMENAAPAGAVRIPPDAPLWLLALFTFSGTLAMHIFVPALDIAGRDLHASSAAMQMTVGFYIFGLAIGQLFYGPLSDRFGRRPALMVGLVIYTAAGVVCMLATQVNVLIAARLFQALGGCAGLVLGRAIVRDTAGTDAVAKRLSLMNMMVMASPALAPLVGGFLADSLGWRAILAALCLLGVTNLLLVWRRLPETHPNIGKASSATLLREYAGLLRSRQFLGFTFGGGCATTSLYAFIASAPFIFVGQLHRPQNEVGMYLSLLVSGVWLGNALCSRLISRISIGRILLVGNLVGMASVFAALVVTLLGLASLYTVLVPMFVFMTGAGMCSPAALTLAVSLNPKVIGSASGLYGSFQMFVGAVCTILAGLGSSPLLAAILVMLAACVLSQFALRAALGSV